MGDNARKGNTLLLLLVCFLLFFVVLGSLQLLVMWLYFFIIIVFVFSDFFFCYCFIAVLSNVVLGFECWRILVCFDFVFFFGGFILETRWNDHLDYAYFKENNLCKNCPLFKL